MVAAKKPAAAKNTRPAPLNPDDLVIDSVEDAPSAFSSSGIADDHPLVKTYLDSYESKIAKKITTSNPELAVKLLRKIAISRNLGIRVQVNGNEVTFRAGEKKASTRKPEGTTEAAQLPTPDALLNGGDEERYEEDE